MSCVTLHETLRPGHVFARVVPAGSTVYVARGQLRLDAPPQWLADRMHVTQHTLHEGQAQAIDRAGWLALHAPAQGDAVQVVLVLPVPWWQPLLSDRLPWRRHGKLAACLDTLRFAPSSRSR